MGPGNPPLGMGQVGSPSMGTNQYNMHLTGSNSNASNSTAQQDQRNFIASGSVT